MLTINTIEQAIVRRIAAVLPNIHVQAYPSNARQFLETFRHVKGAVLVQYTGREREYLAPTRGKQKISVEISVISKSLHDHTGVYPLLDASFLAVSGVFLKSEAAAGEEEKELGLMFFQQEEGFEAYLDKNGLWVYTQQYKSNSFPFLTPEEVTEQLITKITLQSGSTTETIIPEPTEN